jgi:hypothetical protein
MEREYCLQIPAIPMLHGVEKEDQHLLGYSWRPFQSPSSAIDCNIDEARLHSNGSAAVTNGSSHKQVRQYLYVIMH